MIHQYSWIRNWVGLTPGLDTAEKKPISVHYWFWDYIMYQITWSHISKDCDFHIPQQKNLKSLNNLFICEVSNSGYPDYG
jgi:hypothetical protein